MTKRPLLEVRDLRTHFATDEGVARAVDGVSFTVDEGEAVGVVGESGSGKTVTALSVMGLVPAPPGRMLPGSSVRLLGEELVGAGESRLRALRGSRISMIFQDPASSLNPVLRAGEQVAEVLRHHRGMGRSEARARVLGLLDEVGIVDPGRVARAYPHELSGGLGQRVAVAMAVACEPDLVLADEPTTALDVTVQARILDLLCRLRREQGMALLLVSHDLAVVAQVCGRVMVMYGGLVVEAGPVERVFREPRHPYTRGLLASSPRAGEELRPIPGSVPAATRWPRGCRFHDRCPEAWDRCVREAPPLFPASESSRAHSRCWLEAAATARGAGP